MRLASGYLGTCAGEGGRTDQDSYFNIHNLDADGRLALFEPDRMLFAGRAQQPLAG
jgi:hypothetical protein